MKEFQAFKDTLSNKALKAIYEESKLEVQNETTEGTEAFSVALATQMAINLLESYEKWLKENTALCEPYIMFLLYHTLNILKRS